MSRDLEQELLACFRGLRPAERRRLLDEARRLAGGEPERVQLPRPAQESVVEALRRLVRSYPMLDRLRLMNAAAELVEGHVLGGRPAAAVIDELEALFQRAHGQSRRCN